MRTMGRLLGPRVLFSQIQRLGKAADHSYRHEGGRRLRMWNDGIMIGFGIDSPKIEKFSHFSTSPVIRALQASRSILREMCKFQVESGTSMGAQAIIHVGPAKIGLYGMEPSVLDCNGEAPDVALMLSERMAEAYSEQMAELCASRSALEELQHIAPEFGTLFHPSHGPFAGNRNDLKRFSRWCSNPFKSMLD